MERNTILLDVETYNKLHDFFVSMETKGIYVSNYNSSWSRVYSNVEAVKVLNDENVRLRNELEMLKNDFANYRVNNPTKLDTAIVYSLKQLKELSLIQILKIKFKK